MRKTTLVKTVFILSVVYLAIQFMVLPLLFSQKETRIHSVKHRSDTEYPVADLHNPTLVFIRTCSGLGIPCILVEPDLLYRLHSTIRPPDLVHLLQRQNVTTFIVLSEHLTERNKEKAFLNQLTDLGFLTSTIKTDTSWRLQPSHVTSHYFLSLRGSVVHLVVLFPRPPGFLWHSAVGDTQLPPALISSYRLSADNSTQTLPFIHQAGAFDKFDVAEISLVSGTVVAPSPIPTFLHQYHHSKFIECNVTRASEFYNKYPADATDEGKLFQRKGRQIIARAKQYLDDLGIPFWLSSGTCLGWYRQCDIITYSKDVDLGIYIRHFRHELLPLFERGGFYLKHVFGKVSDSYELSFQAGDIKLDLFFFYEEQDYTWNGGTHHKTGQKYKYIFPKFSLCWTVFLDLKVLVPCPPQPYIEANYGTSWREPVRHWEWYKSPPNVRENGVWPKEEWDSVIQVY